MKLLALIAITCILATSFATSDEEVLAKINKLQSTKYGKTLFETIQLQIASGQGFEELVSALQEQHDSIQAEQKDDDAFIAKYSSECAADLEKLTSDIAASVKRIEDLTAELGEKVPKRDQAIQDKAKRIEERDITINKNIQLEKNRQVKDAEWAEEQQQHDSAQYGIERAKQIIEQSVKANFLQKKSVDVMAQVSQHFNKHAKSEYNRKSWNDLFALLSQITASAPIQADSSIVQKIIDICDRLIAKISESREIERRDYKNFVDAYDTTKSQNLDRIAKLNVEIEQLTNEIDVLSKRINNAQSEKNDQEARRNNKQTEHDERLNLCNQEQTNYNQRRATRSDETSIFNQALDLIQSHIRYLKQYAANESGATQAAL